MTEVAHVEGVTRRALRVGCDTETHTFGPGKLAPPIVCATVAWHEEGQVVRGLIGNGEKDDAGSPLLETEFGSYFDDDSRETVWHHASYDLACFAATYPETIPAIFRALRAGRVRDTLIRELLLNLALTGRLDKQAFSDGSGGGGRISYTLGDLEWKYLKHDRRAEKKKVEGDAVRINFAAFDGLTAEAYTAEFRDYAMDDAEGVLLVADQQDALAMQALAEGRLFIDPFRTEWLHVWMDFALQLASCYGLTTDLERHAFVEAAIQQEVRPERLQKLIASGILRPPVLPRPHVHGTKMTEGKKESVNKKQLAAWVQAVAERVGYQLKSTPTGGVCTDKEVIEELSHHDEVLAEYHNRQINQKMLTTDLPRMKAPLVHANFRVLVETGRTSSFGGSDEYPSMNGQNPHPQARQIIVPRPGNVLFSVDYSSIELVTLAQKCLSVFKFSALADLLNAGGDPHAYLGAQLCHQLHGDFRSSCDSAGVLERPAIYNTFLSLKKQSCPTHGLNFSDICAACGRTLELRKLYDHYRKFAKPTGLGYPGGLGPVTFVSYAKKTYGVTVDVETAKLLKRIWLETYPEMVRYFEWVNTCCNDPNYPGQYAYVSPLGMYRANATYCATANGAGLQTPSAEGNKMAFCEVMQECYDPTLGSVLYGTHPTLFVHDEIFGEMPDDGLMHERLLRIGEIMVACMARICPDVKIKANPALMRRWNKAAEAVYGPDGRIAVWEPKAAA